jgi:hypothetical protein
MIVVRHHNHRFCDPCRAARRKQQLQTYPHGKLRMKGDGRSQRREIRYTMRSDFQLHLPAMRAELERQMGALVMPRVAVNDPLELPSYRSATQRRGTGNGPRSAT